MAFNEFKEFLVEKGRLDTLDKNTELDQIYPLEYQWITI